MPRRTDAARLSCEPLEARDVPAILIDATINADATLISPTGGLISVREIAFDEGTPVVFTDGSPVDPAIRSATADDVVTFTQSGNSLTITGSDGIYGRITNLNNSLVFFGTSLTVGGVTGLQVSMQLGGNDRVTENTRFASFIDAGPGNDSVTVIGGQYIPQVAALFNPQALTALAQYASTLPAAKVVNGGDGDDTLLGFGAFLDLDLLGGNGNDRVTMDGFGAVCTLDGGAGNDTVIGPVLGAGNFLGGGAGRDNITGSPVSIFNVLDGGPDGDIIFGGGGSEIILGGSGVDFLDGGGGGDIYLAIDVDSDIILNRAGDTVFADSFDSRAPR